MAIKNLVLNDIDDIIFISDIHFGAKASMMIEFADDVVDYFDNFFFPLIQSEINNGFHPIVVVAGDYFDNRQHIDIDIMNRAMDVMEKMSSICKVYMIIGNHDMYKERDTSVTSIRIFEKYKNVTIIDDKLSLTIKGNHSFLLSSWNCDRSNENKMIAKYKDKYDYFVLHTSISGMTYDNGKEIVDGLNLTAMDDSCRIISGHIHKRQSNKKAMYLGSPYMIRRSDIGNEKGIYCFRNNSSDNIEVKFYQNDYSPKYLICKFSDYGKDPEKWKDVVKNNYVYIFFEDGEDKKINVFEFSNQLQQYNPRRIFLKSNENKKQDGEEYNYSEESSIEEVFVNQISQKGLSDKEYEDCLKLNEDYIKRATEE